MDQIKFGRRLNQARKAKKITSEELARRLGLNASYVRQIECGNRKPSMDTLIAVCNELSVSPDFLLRGDLKLDCSSELEMIEDRLSKLPQKELHLFGRFVNVMYEESERDAKRNKEQA